MKKAASIIEIECNRIRPFADQPRKYFDAGALKDLERSIRAAGQQVEIRVRLLPVPDGKCAFELIDGQRRWHACSALKIKVRAIVDDISDPEDQFLASILANFAREGHSAVEVAHAIARLRKRPEIAALPRTQQAAKIGELFGRSDEWVWSHEYLLAMNPVVLELMSPAVPDEKRLTMQTALLLRYLPHDAQGALARQISGAELPLRDAQKMIRSFARETGAKLRSRSEQPKATRNRFVGSVTRIADEADRMLDLRAADFERMFSGAPESERESAVLRIERAINQLNQMLQTLRRMQSRRAA